MKPESGYSTDAELAAAIKAHQLARQIAISKPTQKNSRACRAALRKREEMELRHPSFADRIGGQK
jgi:hypothetical protein